MRYEGGLMTEKEKAVFKINTNKIMFMTTNVEEYWKNLNIGSNGVFGKTINEVRDIMMTMRWSAFNRHRQIFQTTFEIGEKNQAVDKRNMGSVMDFIM